MKIKNDFVTNSSSCSFVGWGLSVEQYELEKIPEFIKFAKEKEINLHQLFYEALEDFLNQEKLELEYCYDTFFIGKKYSSMDLDQTMREFRNEIDEKLKKLGINMPVGEIDEAWHD